MKKYRIINNTTLHSFKKGDIVTKCSGNLLKQIIKSDGRCDRQSFWMTSDGDYHNSWVVGKTDIEEIKA